MTIFYLITSGFLSLLGQVILSRELLCAFSSSELFVIAGISISLLGSSMGVFTSFRTTKKRIKWLFSLYGFLLIILFLMATASRSFFGAERGLILPISQQFLTSFIIFFPFGFLSGRLFGEISLVYLKEGGSVAKSYIFDTLGAVLGGIFTLLLNFFRPSLSFFAVAFLVISIFSFLLEKRIVYNFISFIFCLILIVSYRNLENFHFFILKNELPTIKEIRETPYGRITISEDRGQIVFYLNNAIFFESESYSAEEFVHIPMLCAEKYDDVLLIGGIGEGGISEIIKYNPRRIDVVEVDKDFVEIPKKYIKDERFLPLSKNNTKIYFSDGRKFLKKSGNYDVILVFSEGTNSISSSRFFTKEFYDEVYKKLNKNGVFAIRIKGAENYYSDLLFKRNYSGLKAISDIFENSLFIPFGTTIGIGIKGEKQELSKILSLFEEKNIECKFLSKGYIKYVMSNERTKEFEKKLKENSFEINSDEKPILYFFSLLLEAGRNYNKLNFITQLFDFFKKFLFLFLSIFTILFLALNLYFKNKSHLFLAFISGFFGMSFEVVLLFVFQFKNGILYKDIGILTSLFMVGLMCGALIIKEKVFSKTKKAVYLFSGVIVCLAFSFLMNEGFSPIFLYLLIVFGGFFSGGLFKIAQNELSYNREESLRHLYFFDLLGGALGGVLTTLLVIPLFGFASTLQYLSLLLIVTSF